MLLLKDTSLVRCSVLALIIQEWDLRAMMNSSMKMSAQSSAVVKKVNWIFGIIKKKVEKKTENIVISVQKAVIPKSKKGCKRTGRGSQKGTKNNQKYRMAVKGIHK